MARMAVPSPAVRSRDAKVLLARGDTVVYSAHGLGNVVGRETRLVGGTKRECVQLEFVSGIRITMPLETAIERLRGVLGRDEFADVKAVLRSPPSPREGTWSNRLRVNRAKLASGRAADLAELVRDGAPFATGGDGPRLSAHERTLYRQARQLLADEIAYVEGATAIDADAWIAAQMAANRGPSADG